MNSSKDVTTSVVMVCGPSSQGKVQRVDEICNLGASAVVAAEDTIFVLTNSGVYDVYTLTLAVNSPAIGIDGGLKHNVLLSADGEVYAWGIGEHGELGLGPRYTNMESPGQLRCSSRVTQVACGNSHSCAVDSFGNAYAWGQNFSRQLGLYTKTRAELPGNAMVEDMVMTPRVLPFSIKNSVAKVACGAGFSMAVTKAGTLWTWGAGECGQLGTGRCKVKEVPSECVIRVNGVPAKVVDAAAGYGHSCALTAEGDVAVWGLNKLGQLGTGDNRTIHEPHVLSANFVGQSVYAKDNSTACVSVQGDLYTWGSGANYRLMHEDCLSVYSPKKVESLEGEKITQFVFSSAASAVLIKTRLFSISPNIGMLNAFSRLELRGCGLWPSTSIVVKFSKSPEAGEEGPDSVAALVPPRSCMGRLSEHGVIACKPPRLTHTGYYDVSIAMDGKNFLQEAQRVFICNDPSVINIENCLYDLRESEFVNITMTCTGLDEVGPGLDVYVRLVNVDNTSLCSPPILAELMPEDVFEEGEAAGGGGDDQSVAGSIASATSFDHNDTKVENFNEHGKKRRILCRNVDLTQLKNKSGATLMLQAQLSRNSTDFPPGNAERIICHEFTPSDAFPNCVPFPGQREITFRGSGFFPLGMQAAIAITTHVNAVPIEDGKAKKKGKRDGRKGSALSNRPITPDNSVTDCLAEMPSVTSLASVGSFIMESESPAFHVLTVPVRFDSVSELAISIPGLQEFVKPGLKLPDNVPSVLKAQILFSLASDANCSLSKAEVAFFFYKEGGVSVSPSICRRFSRQMFTFSGIDKWISFQPNNPKIMFSDKENGFFQTVDVQAVSSEDGEAYDLICELPDHEMQEPTAEGEQAEVGADAALGMASFVQSESFAERPNMSYKSLRVALLLDGVTPPEEHNMCSINIFDQVSIIELANALAKEGATRGATISYVASGLIPSDACVVRLRGVNDAVVDLRGTIGDINEETNSGTFSFEMPDSLEDIEPHVKGKEKKVFVDISIDGGLTFDTSDSPILLVGKY